MKPKRAHASSSAGELNAPRQLDIDRATAELPLISQNPPLLALDQVKAVDVSAQGEGGFDVRSVSVTYTRCQIQLSIKNLVYHAAKLSAHIIGNGPLAAGLIGALQRQLAYDKNVAADATEALESLGYAHGLVAKALDQNRYANDGSVCVC